MNFYMEDAKLRLIGLQSFIVRLRYLEVSTCYS
jgi:hypothetical protein